MYISHLQTPHMSLAPAVARRTQVIPKMSVLTALSVAAGHESGLGSSRRRSRTRRRHSQCHRLRSKKSKTLIRPIQSSTPEWYTTPVWYTFVYFIASPNHHRCFSNKMSWLHIHTNKSSTKFQINWTSSGSTVKCSKMDVLQALPKMLSPPNDTPIFCKFLCDNTTEFSEIWRHGSYWLIESYCVVFMRKTYSLELKIEFNDFTVSLRGGWLYPCWIWWCGWCSCVPLVCHQRNGLCYHW